MSMHCSRNAVTGALLALFASVGANVYLGWIYQSVRLKYRTLAARVGSSVAGA